VWALLKVGPGSYSRSLENVIVWTGSDNNSLSKSI
jgi:hypothetical protein